MTQRFRVNNVFAPFSGQPLQVTKVTVTPYLSAGQLIADPTDDTTLVPDKGFGTVVNGILTGTDGAAGIELQSDTDDLGLGAPLMYKMTFLGVRAGGKPVQINPVMFPASTDDADVQLSDHIGAAETPESTSTTITLPHGDGTTYLNDQGTFTEPAEGASLPAQSGNGGKFLTTDGTTPSWGTPAGGGGGDVAADTHAASSKTTPADADELPLVDSAAGNGLKKLTWANLKTAAVTAATVGAVVHAATAKTNPVTNDELALIDSAASNALKRITYGNLATAIIALITDSAPGTLDTLNELAAALGDDPNFAATITAALAGKQPLDADLTAIAALTTTAFGRSLLTLADAAAGRAALGPTGTADATTYLRGDGTWATPAGGGSSAVAVNAQTASYTLVLSDQDKAIEVTSSSDLTVTVPPNASVALPVGSVIEVGRFGTGQVSLVAGAGVTIQTSTSLVLRAQYSTAVLRKRATNTWILSGDLQ